MTLRVCVSVCMCMRAEHTGTLVCASVYDKQGSPVTQQYAWFRAATNHQCFRQKSIIEMMAPRNI